MTNWYWLQSKTYFNFIFKKKMTCTEDNSIIGIVVTLVSIKRISIRLVIILDNIGQNGDCGETLKKITTTILLLLATDLSVWENESEWESVERRTKQ